MVVNKLVEDAELQDEAVTEASEAVDDMRKALTRLEELGLQAYMSLQHSRIRIPTAFLVEIENKNKVIL